jgi:hypothetical protein
MQTQTGISGVFHVVRQFFGKTAIAAISATESTTQRGMTKKTVTLNADPAIDLMREICRDTEKD